ncbi:MAG: single-stranded-DNA-specific exonuclease RecJ [Desulfatibacillum sp.]|nr:single-stranded-DNA-specific exonuclease RecJ [Desulfatibacillum sp.]
MKRRWELCTPDLKAVETLSKFLGCHRAIAGAMVNRGIREPGAAERFLGPSLADLASPFLLKDMDKAVSRIIRAIQARENILVFGDYDADGVCSTALLTEFLQEAGARVFFHVPHRTKEGYGFSPSHVLNPVLSKKIQLVITVDNGISSHKAIEEAREAGVDVIVTDHHTPSDTPPRALAVIDPKLPGCPSGLDHLAGVGVAFYLCICLRMAMREQGLWPDGKEPNLKHKCDLVALGTVADMVPLVGENRILTTAGLEVMGAALRPGLRALLEVSAVDCNAVTAHDLAFRVAPRLNAPGRVNHANLAVELLLERDPAKARRLAGEVDGLNRQRQRMSEDLYASVLSLLKSDEDLKGQRSLVLAHPGWHPGVIGIAAAKLVREFNCPVVLISLNENMGKGSARSIPGVDLYQALQGCESQLLAFGGHAQAAGLTIHNESIDTFRGLFDHQVMGSSTARDFEPVLTIDYHVDTGDVGPEFANQIESMAPFGMSNPEPVFLSRGVGIRQGPTVGRGHRRMAFQSQEGDPRPLQAIWFNAQDRLVPSIADEVAFRVQWNRWKDRQTVQAVVEGIRDN